MTRQEFDIRPDNMGRLIFNGRLLAEAKSDQTTIRVYESERGYVGESILLDRDDEGQPVVSHYAYTARTGDRLARAMMRDLGGMFRDDPDVGLVRKALDEAGIESGRRV